MTDWPVRSADLNPVETLWGILARNVGKRGPFSQDDLARFVKEEWRKLPMSTIDALVLSFEQRLRKCIAAGGRAVKP